MKPWHMWACDAFVALAIILVAIGGSAYAVIPALGCALMMGAMVLMMVRMGRSHD